MAFSKLWMPIQKFCECYEMDESKNITGLRGQQISQKNFQMILPGTYAQCISLSLRR